METSPVCAIKYRNPGKIILSRILNILGLYQFEIKPSFARTIPVYFVIGLSVAAFAFELSANTNRILTEAASINGTKIMNVVSAWKYILKPAAVLAILIAFWRKSITLTNLTNEINKFNELSTRNSKGMWQKSSRLAYLSLLAFLLYLASMTVTRILYILLQPRPWRLRFFGLNLMQEETFALVTRNLTEAIRVFCSGYLGILLVEFSNGPGAESRHILGPPFCS
jgi:hypothetical protein